MSSKLGEVVYPESDGKPMAETDMHYEAIVDLRRRLAALFLGRGDVYVTGNILVYYQEGNPKVRLSPDVMVVLGVSPGIRRTYQIWREGAYPSVVFEVTSAGTRRADLQHKFKIYESVWRVSEYFLFDPTDEYLTPALRGFRLSEGSYVELPQQDGCLVSEQLGVTICRDGGYLRLYDAVTGELILPPEERQAERDRLAKLAAEQARERERLEKERERLAKLAAEQARERERLARESAEAEVARLQAELAKYRGSGQ